MHQELSVNLELVHIAVFWMRNLALALNYSMVIYMHVLNLSLLKWAWLQKSAVARLNFLSLLPLLFVGRVVVGNQVTALFQELLRKWWLPDDLSDSLWHCPVIRSPFPLQCREGINLCSGIEPIIKTILWTSWSFKLPSCVVGTFLICKFSPSWNMAAMLSRLNHINHSIE